MSETIKKTKKRKVNGVKFTKKYQPSPEAKSKGWDRRKQKIQMLETIMQMYNMDANEFQNMLKQAKGNLKSGNKVGMSVGDLAMANYVEGVVGGKFIVDRMDRHISKAPQEVQQTTYNVDIELEQEEQEEIKELLNRNFDDEKK